ncbi:unnamed protein product [Fusarium graminearum]|nr:unnamed protein product [Fusarium graminearum]
MCRENLAAIFHAQDRDDDTAHEHETVINACKQRLIYKRFGRSKLQRVCIENCLSTQGASKDLGEITIDIIILLRLCSWITSRYPDVGPSHVLSLTICGSLGLGIQSHCVHQIQRQFQITTVTGRPGDESNRHHEQRASE